ncbi:MAG: PaaI family thioesterase [Thermodesulfobacteriota bacterium]
MDTTGTPPNPDEEKRLESLMEPVNNSPYYRHIRMRLGKLSVEGCVMTLEVGDEHMNVFGNGHGGAVASLADSACGLALVPSLKQGEFAVTQNLFVNYFRPVKKGTLTARGKIVNRGKTSAVLEAEIFNEAGELVARAQTTHAIR